MIDDLPVEVTGHPAVGAWLQSGARAVMVQGGGVGERASIALFWDGDRAPRAFMKTARDPRGRAALRREHQALTTVHALAGLRHTIPEPLALIEEPDVTAHVTRAVPGVPLTVLGSRLGVGGRRAQLQAALSWLGSLHAATAGERLHIDLEDIERALADELPGRGHDVFRRRILDAAGPLACSGLRTVRCHGDFWGGNLLYSEGEVCVIDWEHSRPAGAPSDDLFLLLSTLPLTPHALARARSRVQAFESAWLGTGRMSRQCSTAASRFLAARSLGPRDMDVLMVLFLIRMISSPVGASPAEWREILRSYAAVPPLFLRRSLGGDA